MCMVSIMFLLLWVRGVIMGWTPALIKKKKHEMSESIVSIIEAQQLSGRKSLKSIAKTQLLGKMNAAFSEFC